MMTLRSAYDAACGKLAARLRTEKEIRDALKKAGYDTAEIEEAISELKALGYIDDKRYCEEFFRYGRKKSKSEAAILRELSQKGVEAELARDTINRMKEEAETEYESDRQVAMRTAVKMTKALLEEGKLPEDKFYAKVGRRLFRLGFDSGTVYGVISDIKGIIRKRYSEDYYDAER